MSRKALDACCRVREGLARAGLKLDGGPLTGLQTARAPHLVLGGRKFHHGSGFLGCHVVTDVPMILSGVPTVLTKEHLSLMLLYTGLNSASGGSSDTRKHETCDNPKCQKRDVNRRCQPLTPTAVEEGRVPRFRWSPAHVGLHRLLPTVQQPREQGQQP